MVKKDVACAVGVPTIEPLVRFRPVGSVDPVTSDQVYGADPPAAASVRL
jgi:hypothetical protein